MWIPLTSEFWRSDHPLLPNRQSGRGRNRPLPLNIFWKFYLKWSIWEKIEPKLHLFYSLFKNGIGDAITVYHDTKMQLTAEMVSKWFDVRLSFIFDDSFLLMNKSRKSKRWCNEQNFYPCSNLFFIDKHLELGWIRNQSPSRQTE